LFIAKVPRCMKDDKFKLRAFRISDIPFLCDGLKDKWILTTDGLSKQISLSWLSVWWWIKKTFTFIYCIICDSKRIGFIGLYNLKPRESAEMTLVILDQNERRIGHGTRAFRIFTQTLKKCNLIEKIIVKVKEDNHTSIAFWRKLGFEDMHSLDGIRVMSIDLKNR
jgi:RimJ/RimL family protein N-acetyltransferase